MSRQRTYRYGELFCGPGGLALGALKAWYRRKQTTYRIEHTWASDKDKDACDTYIRNICPENPESVFCTPVDKLDFTYVSTEYPIDLLGFGFPCNDYSLVGKKRGINGEFGKLYSFGVRALRAFEPLAFVAENVSGLRSADNGTTIFQILDELEQAGSGYTITPHIYKMEEWGIPQTRHRVIIVGIRDDLDKKYRVPLSLREKSERQGKTFEYATCKQAIERKSGKPLLNNERTRQSDQVIRRLECIMPGENAWNATIADPSLRLNVKSAHLSNIYRRLDPKRPAYTVTGSGGGGTHVYHWREPRALTNRERARLQTFPDSFHFDGSKESVRKQIGMAVPPMMSAIIFRAIIKTLLGVEYEYTKENFSRTQTSLQLED